MATISITVMKVKKPWVKALLEIKDQFSHNAFLLKGENNKVEGIGIAKAIRARGDRQPGWHGVVREGEYVVMVDYPFTIWIADDHDLLYMGIDPEA
jgi:hypothetical protein